MEDRMEREADKLSFEDAGRMLLANARREHPMLTPDMRRWIEHACRRLNRLIRVSLIALALLIFATSSALEHGAMGAPAAPPVVLIGSSSAISLGTSPHISLRGRVSKNKTHNPMSLGGVNIFKNDSSVDYRIVRIRWTLDGSAVSPGETVESDVALTILRDHRENSLDSGDELTASHSYFAYGAPQHGMQAKVPEGGFVLPANTSLSIGSVSSFFQNGRPIEVADDRIDDNLMAMNYDIELRRADTVVEAPIYSYRSPFRDRSFVPDANRHEAPYTAFRNVSGRPVEVYGLGDFFSMSSAGTSRQTMNVYLNGKLDAEFAQPNRDINADLPPTPIIIPYRRTLQPGDLIAVKGRIDVERALVFDYVGYLFAGPGLEPSRERLEVVSVDFNRDGFDDIVDLDARGSIWVSLRVGSGLEDTGDEWIRGLPPSVHLTAHDANGDGVPDLHATASTGLCLDLLTNLADTSFTPKYCSGRPADPEARQSVWGDFNGDGFLDNFVTRTNPDRYEVALGSSSGLSEYIPWAYGYGDVDRLFVWDGNDDGRDDVMAEWGGQCMVWQSAGSEFEPIHCK
jgi:hypothetical protein